MRFLNPAKKPARRAAKPPRDGKKTATAPERVRRIDPAALRRNLKRGATALVLAGLAGGGYYTWTEALPGQALNWAERTVLQSTAELGLVVQEVYAIGRSETEREDLVAAIGVAIGDPILGVDPDAVRLQVEALDWVKTASVRRTLPDTIIVEIVERRAVAIWQNQDRFVLIDPDGVEIGEKDVHRHGHLKVVVGPDAPDHTMDLLDILASEPELEDRVLAAVRIGQRRWNLRLEDGIDVRLPEDDPASAWQLLADYQRDHEILSRAIGAIDLRYPDRMSVQLTEPGLQEIKGRSVTDEET